ncbi:MAG: response regulator transcription factor [Bifidobacteriaceae bacterium]|nr:response regulator transcription factor [Bifidobacteriaceae bacterium]
MRVLVVDDDPFVTESLATILGASATVEVVATGHNAAEAVQLWEEFTPDIALLDIQMGPAGGAESDEGAASRDRELNQSGSAPLDAGSPNAPTGLDAARTILARWPLAKVVFLTTFVDDSYIMAALRMGAKGYLIKQDVAAIAPALGTVMAGGSVFGTEVVGRIDGLVTEPDPKPTGISQLTDRESEVAALVAEGLDNREIATRAFLSEGTVRNLVSGILTKLALRNRTQLAIWYLRDR